MSYAIQDAISAYIHREFVFDGTELDPGESFLEGGIVDSMGILEIVLFLEEEFGISVADEDVLPEHFDSIQRLAGYVSGRLAQARVEAVERAG